MSLSTPVETFGFGQRVQAVRRLEIQFAQRSTPPGASLLEAVGNILNHFSGPSPMGSCAQLRVPFSSFRLNIGDGTPKWGPTPIPSKHPYMGLSLRLNREIPKYRCVSKWRSPTNLSFPAGLPLKVDPQTTVAWCPKKARYRNSPPAVQHSMFRP